MLGSRARKGFGTITFAAPCRRRRFRREVSVREGIFRGEPSTTPEGARGLVVDPLPDGRHLGTKGRPPGTRPIGRRRISAANDAVRVRGAGPRRSAGAR